MALTLRLLSNVESSGLDKMRSIQSRPFTKSLQHIRKSLVSASSGCIKQKIRNFSTDSFAHGTNTAYLEQMCEAWKKNSASVHASWDAYFKNIASGLSQEICFSPPPNNATHLNVLRDINSNYSSSDAQTNPLGYDLSRMIRLVQAYQQRGHEFAQLDPLQLPNKRPFVRERMIESRTRPIDFENFGFTESDLDRVFKSPLQDVKGLLSSQCPPMTLRQIIQRLEQIYCGSIGVETSHIENVEIKNFIYDALETPTRLEYEADFKKKILKRTMRAVLFEQFFGTKFNTSKRFGIDGCETAIIIVKGITKKAVLDGIDSVVIGMPHRGRLNLLTNVLHKPMKQMMNEFQGMTGFGGRDWGNTGDVKYHLGVDYDHFDLDAQKMIHLSVAANPSHLEAIDPVVLGHCRAKQYYMKDSSRSLVLPLLMHGDASFSGQGIVYETLQMSKLHNYTAGGTIHVIVNNQIGFTTNSSDQSSGQHCSDLAKCLEAPIFHVNADDPEACTRIATLALDYRQKFKGDVFIDVVGYRRFGHNELDMPKFTQPVMYNIIDKHPNILEKYSQKLIKEGVVTRAEFEEMKQDCLKYYNAEYDESQKKKFVIPYKYTKQWKHMALPTQPCPPQNTGVPLKTLKEVGQVISTLPEDKIVPHPTIKRIYKARLDSIKSGSNVDFGLAEALAYGTLLKQNHHIRLAGQDAQRGTFSHRHAVVHDQKIQKIYCPLKEFVKSESLPHTIEICNSPLNEYAALCYEIGYASEHPDSLSIWEAQFGDFANGAQIAIDQFIASAETKWGNQCGIVLLLPHGYDGQGPEHSSARIERFLQLCDDREDVIDPDSWNQSKRCVIQQHNFQVVNCSTPANFFHVLRRQICRGFRKPLVCISPKRMLKQRATFSILQEMAENTSFLRYIPNIKVQGKEQLVLTEKNIATILTQEDPDILRLILCSGQIYYDLVAHREKQKLTKNVAIARVEQLSPFPFDLVIDDIKRYPNLKYIVWAQEEPMNAGPWAYASKRISSSLKYLGHPNNIRQPIYAGRDVNGSPAGGDAKLHEIELQQILRDAFDLNRTQNSYLEKYGIRASQPSP